MFTFREIVIKIFSILVLFLFVVSPVASMVTPSKIVISGTDGTIISRQVQFSGNISPVLLPCSIQSENGECLLPPSFVKIESSEQIISPEMVKLSLLFNFTDLDNGIYTGELVFYSDHNFSYVPIQVQVKDPFLSMFILLISGIIIGSAITVNNTYYYPKHKLKEDYTDLENKYKQFTSSRNIDIEQEDFDDKMLHFFGNIKYYIETLQFSTAQKSINEAHNLLLECRHDYDDRHKMLCTLKWLKTVIDAAKQEHIAKHVSTTLSDLREQSIEPLEKKIKENIQSEEMNISVKHYTSIVFAIWENEDGLKLKPYPEKLDNIGEFEEIPTQPIANVPKDNKSGSKSSGDSQNSKFIYLTPWIAFAGLTITLVIVGIFELYVKNPTYGMNGILDAAFTVVWGIGAPVTSKALVDIVSFSIK